MRLLDTSRIALCSSLVTLAACSTPPSISAEPPARAAEAAASQGDNGNTPQNNPIRSMSADTDPAQLVFVSIPGGTSGSAKIADGPFVLTSAYSNYGGFVVSIVDGANCADPAVPHVTVLLPTWFQNQAQAQGVRIGVPAGKAMCSDSNVGGPNFSGFKLYE